MNSLFLDTPPFFLPRSASLVSQLLVVNSLIVAISDSPQLVLGLGKLKIDQARKRLLHHRFT